MATEKMKRLKLIAVKSEREDLFRELMILGSVQISEQEKETSNSEKTGSYFRENAGLSECRTEYEMLLQGLELLNKYAPSKSGLFRRKPRVSKRTFFDEASLRESIEISNNIRTADVRIEGIRAEEAVIKGLLDTIKPWSSLDIPFELVETETCFLVPGSVPASVKLTAVEKDLNSEVPESQIIKIISDREAHYIMLVAMKENKQTVLELLQKCGFEPLEAGSMKTTAGENILEFRGRLAALSSEKKELTAAICALSASENELKLCADRLLTKAEKAENEERLLCTEFTINFEGWIPASEEKALVSVLSGFDCAWETTEPAKDETAIVPFKLGHGLFYRLRRRKYLRAGRKPFRPLSVKTNYMNLIKGS